MYFYYRTNYSERKLNDLPGSAHIIIVMPLRLFRPQEFIQEESGILIKNREGIPLRIRAIEEDILRISFQPDANWRLNRTWIIIGKNGEDPCEGRSRDDLLPFGCPPVQHKQEKNQINLCTKNLIITVNKNPFWMKIETSDCKVLAVDDAYWWNTNGKALKVESLASKKEHYYGLGEKSGELNKAGRRFKFLNHDAVGYNAKSSDPLYKHIPFLICWQPELQVAFGILYDNLTQTQMAFNPVFGPNAGLRTYQAENGDLDAYFILGPSIPEVVEKLARLTGRPVLPPKYTLGYLASSMGYTEGDDAERRLQEFRDKCAEHEIPCDLFHLSSGYCKAEDGKRYVFQWNRKRFPDPKKAIEKFHDAGMQVSANIKPCLLTSHPKYDEVKSLGAFIRRKDTGDPLISPFWGGLGSFIDFTNPEGWKWWQENAKKELLENGIDSLWNDNNEFDLPGGKAEVDGFGKAISADQYSPIQTLLMTRASYERQKKYKPHERPFTITRAGSPGIQRYAQTWSGDNVSSWNTLRYNLPMGLGLGLSGMPNYGHDVGGFVGKKPSAELFLRWVQHGIFMPRFCIHSWRLDRSANEPWMYPEMLPLVKEAIYLRYRLLPYLYSLFYEASQTGHPIQRPLVYEFPDDPRVSDESFTFMLGPNLLVSNILQKGEKAHPVYLPAGSAWYDIWTGDFYEGGQTISIEVTPGTIPLFARAGGMIPTGHPLLRINCEADDFRQVACFPEIKGSSQFLLYEDDGISLDHQKGKYSLINMEMESDEKNIRVKGEFSHRGYPLTYKKIDVVVSEQEKRKLFAEGLCRIAK
jgi:alpha-glucosidase